MKIYKTNNPLSDLGTAIGIGLLAGIAGTAAITISQTIAMKITKKPMGDAPVKAADKVLDVKPSGEAEKEKVAQEVHWAYGASWGIVRGFIAMAGLRGFQASAAHFAAIWAAKLILFPALKLGPVITEEKPEDTAIDAWHHAVYALAAGLSYDALQPQKAETGLHKLQRKARKMRNRMADKIASLKR